MRDLQGEVIASTFNDITKCLSKLSRMIVWVAERTLSAKEFIMFTDEFSKEKETEIDRYGENKHD